MEAEYIALSQAMSDRIPLRRLLSEIATEMDIAGIKQYVIKYTVFEENNGPITTVTVMNIIYVPSTLL